MDKKIITGIALFVAFLLIIWADIFLLNFVLFGVVVYFAFDEALKIFEMKNDKLIYFALAIYLCVAIFGANGVDVSKIVFVYLAIIAGILAYIKSKNFTLFLPFVYPLAPLCLLFGVYLSFGMGFFAWLILTAIACDSGAYFIGKSIGSIKFSPSSPNKTLEGVIGGVIVGTIVGVIIGFLFLDESFFKALCVSFFVAIFGVFGDLFESYLKRIANVKDSGNLFAGHGGMLDRIDAYLFAAVAMSLFY